MYITIAQTITIRSQYFENCNTNEKEMFYA